jgi:hypothetical protein
VILVARGSTLGDRAAKVRHEAGVMRHPVHLTFEAEPSPGIWRSTPRALDNSSATRHAARVDQWADELTRFGKRCPQHFG